MKSLFIVALLGMSGLACNAVDRAIDCGNICGKYKDCVGPSTYDTGACASRCRTYAADSDANNRRVDTCRACTSGQACSGAVFGCISECAGIPFNP